MVAYNQGVGSWHHQTSAHPCPEALPFAFVSAFKNMCCMQHAILGAEGQSPAAGERNKNPGSGTTAALLLCLHLLEQRQEKAL